MSSLSIDYSLSFNDLRLLDLREQDAEIAMLPYQLNFWKTGYGLALGLPVRYHNGRYKDGEPEMNRLQDLIHHGAYKKFIKTIEPPPNVTIVSRILSFAAMGHTNFFIKMYSARSKRYKMLPLESKKIVYWGSRGNIMWEAMNDKIAYQDRGEHGFACPEVYERIKQARSMQQEFYEESKMIGRAYVGWKRKYGEARADVMRESERARLYKAFEAKINPLRALPQPAHDPLLIGMPRFEVLGEVPLEVFMM